eukprot:12449753-Ditylum_brightwellii.AAC.1
MGYVMALHVWAIAEDVHQMLVVFSLRFSYPCVVKVEFTFDFWRSLITVLSHFPSKCGSSFESSKIVMLVPMHICAHLNMVDKDSTACIFGAIYYCLREILLVSYLWEYSRCDQCVEYI